MRILLLCDEYPPGLHGGIGSFTKSLSSTLSKKGHKVFVVGFPFWQYGGCDHCIDEDDVSIYRIRRSLNSSSFISVGLRKLLNKLNLLGLLVSWDFKNFQKYVYSFVELHKIDIVEIPDYADYFCLRGFIFRGWNFKIPLVIRLHGNSSYLSLQLEGLVRSFVYKNEIKLLESANHLIAVSEFILKQTFFLFPNLKCDSDVVYNGLDLSFIGDVNNFTREKIVIFSGSINENKGIFRLLEIWPRVAALYPDWKLYIFGKGELSNFLYQNDSVKFFGHLNQKELFYFYDKAEIAVFPSVCESFGLGVLEAMAHGLAVIFTKTTSGPELVSHVVDGVLIDPLNLDDLCKSLILLMGNDILRNEIQFNARNKVLGLFDINFTIDGSLRIYENLLNE